MNLNNHDQDFVVDLKVYDWAEDIVERTKEVHGDDYRDFLLHVVVDHLTPFDTAMLVGQLADRVASFELARGDDHPLWLADEQEDDHVVDLEKLRVDIDEPNFLREYLASCDRCRHHADVSTPATTYAWAVVDGEPTKVAVCDECADEIADINIHNAEIADTHTTTKETK